MSAWRLGSQQPEIGTAGTGPKDQILTFIGRFAKYIPGDVMAIYAAAVVMMQPVQPATGAPKAPVVSTEAWVITLVATPIIVLVAGWLAKRKWSKVGLAAAFSVPAFAAWSSTIPHSVWENWDYFTANPAIVYLVLGLFALFLPQVADKLIDG